MRRGRSPAHLPFLLFLIENTQSAVDVVGGSRHVRGVFRGEKHRQAGDIVRLTEARERDLAEQRLQLDWIVQQAQLIGVSMAPGAMLFTVIPSPPSSTARLRVNIRMPPLLMQ